MGIPCEEGPCSEISGQRAPFCQGNKTCENQLNKVWQPLLLKPLADKYPEHYTGINILGTVQQASGVAGAVVGSPNISVGSPCGLFKMCVHPQNEGATAVTEAFWDLYFSKQVLADR